ncbi:MAG: agmatine deiminase family protein [bacterium]|nr:agmatine deiminase family protein [bacterium]
MQYTPKIIRIAGLFVCLGLTTVTPTGEPEEGAFLPIGLTADELTRLHEIGRDHRGTPPPVGAIRNPAEWEPSEGVLVRWPLGVPVGLIAEMSEDVVVTTVVGNASQETSAFNTYSANGVNMANVEFLLAPTNSIWIRDYGPWFVYRDQDLAIVDHVYNRPRPLDDVVPAELGTAWGLDVYGMDLIHTGGNHMSDGLGMSMSTELVTLENPALNQAQIDQFMLDYLGNDYTVLSYVQSGGIHHIDTWAKFLGPSTVMVKDVAPSHPTYDELNARAAFLAQQTSPWGVPYEVVRVYCPSGTYYTNSLILNDKVLVPLFGSSWDDDALQTYADAMPGYEVLGFTGSWATEDALHCRTMGVPDRHVLQIDHVPYRTEDITTGDYEIIAEIVPHSGTSLQPGQLTIHYSVDGGTWQETPLTATPQPNTYSGTIPAQPEDAVVSYYLEAADGSGRVETHPYIGQAWAHEFTATCPLNPIVDVVADGSTWVCPGTSRLLQANVTGGAGPFGYQWLRDGVEIAGATDATYLAAEGDSHLYNCRVSGDGCSAPRTDDQDLQLDWRAEPVFGGLGSASNGQTGTCTIDLTWDAAFLPCGDDATYSVYRSTDAGFTPDASNRVAVVAGTGFADAADLSHGVEVHYAVRARDPNTGLEDDNTLRLSAVPTDSGAQTTPFSEDFENGATWLDWTTTFGPGPHSDGSWKSSSAAAQRPPNSSGSYALVDSDAFGPGTTTSTDLISPTIDLGGTELISVTLEYDLYYRYRDGDDTGVEVYDGTQWQTVWTAPAADVQAHHAWDVTGYAAGNPDFAVRFRYQNAAHDYWFAVDNVLLRGEEPGLCAAGSVPVVTVPDGTEAGTSPLLAARSEAGVELTWDVATPDCASSGYHLIWGRGADVTSLGISGSDCTLDASGSHLWTAAPDSPGDWIWFLVVADDGAGTEGGWGAGPGAAERSLDPSGECGAVVLLPGACVP